MKLKTLKLLSPWVIVGLPLFLTHPALAAAPGVSNVESFIKSIISVVTGLAGLIATGFFVVGGLTYIVSSGNPVKLDKAKRTLIFAVIGLSITIAAFVISNIVTSLATSAFGS